MGRPVRKRTPLVYHSITRPGHELPRDRPETESVSGILGDSVQGQPAGFGTENTRLAGIFLDLQCSLQPANRPLPTDPTLLWPCRLGADTELDALFEDARNQVWLDRPRCA